MSPAKPPAKPPRAPGRAEPSTPKPAPTAATKAIHTAWPLAVIGALAMASGNPLTPTTAGGDTTLASPPPAREAAAMPAATLSSDRVSAHFIDVDQASSALLEFPCGAVLIDAGARDQTSVDHLVGYLDAFFARRPDLHRRINTVFVTHTHVDHNRGLEAVAERFDIGGYVYNGHLTGSGRVGAKWMADHARQTKIPTDSLSESQISSSQGYTDGVVDAVACPRVDPTINVLSAAYPENPGWDEGEYDNENNQSLVVRVAYGKTSFLFTGDLEEPAIDTLVEKYRASGALRSSVYVVGHHGSANGTTRGLLDAVRPDIAVMSMGRPEVHVPWTAWAYGHPRRDVVELLDQSITRPRDRIEDVQVADGVKRFSPYTIRHAVYATGWDGPITIAGDASGALKVEREPGG